jgi:hypothetical protein
MGRAAKYLQAVVELILEALPLRSILRQLTKVKPKHFQKT